MPHRTSSSKTAIVAGTLAGLLAAAAGGYLLLERQAGAPAQAPASAPPAAAGSAPPPAAPAAAAPAASRSKDQAGAALMALPELRAWSAFIEKNSGGAARGALIEYEEAPRLVKGKRYWQFSFVENSAEAAHRWESFLVATSGDEILVEDEAGDELLSLERWRREKQPMQRRGSSSSSPAPDL